ncbi:MAG TPA: MerR family transcriptional regulator [Gammaproteobacteria bacterium]|nr:MerR family transcriptional regulator [Gammaproteobacteria bacterium]
MNESMTIGQLAAAAGVGIETVRYYQRRGLLRVPEKPYGGIRRYRIADAERVRFIKAAQALGFQLAEIEELLTLETGGTCAEVSLLAEKKRQTIRDRIASLKQLDRTLSELLSRCASTNGNVSCPIVTILLGKAATKP